MISRQELRSIPGTHRLIQRSRNQLAYLREKATAVPSGLSSGDRVQSSPGNTAGKCVDAATDLARYIAELEATLKELQVGAKEFINTFDPEINREFITRSILVQRYIYCKAWPEIADMMGYDLRYIHRLHKAALDRLQK